MRRLIDGHAHLRPAHPIGWVDPEIGSTILPYGKVRQKNGDVRQVVPAYFVDTAFTADTLVAVMEQYKVDKAVLMAHFGSDIGPSAVDAMNKYPGKFAGAVSVRPLPESIEELYHWNRQGIGILKFELRSMYELYPDITISSPVVMSILDEAEKLGMTVVVDPSPSSFPCFRPDCMREAIEAHPDTKFVICHMALPFKGIREVPEVYDKWKHMISLGKLDTVSFDVTAIPDLFVEENFPYPSAMDLLHELYDICGPKKLIWGTDIPGTFNTATYYQMVQAFERVTFLNEEEKDRLFYLNADELYFAKQNENK